MRIIGKRLRYSIELFADCFSGLLRERIYPMIEEAQEILGAVTDSHLAVDRLTAIRTHIQTYRPAEWPRFKKGLDALIRAQRRRFPNERKLFQLVAALAGIALGTAFGDIGEETVLMRAHRMSRNYQLCCKQQF